MTPTLLAIDISRYVFTFINWQTDSKPEGL